MRHLKIKLKLKTLRMNPQQTICPGLEAARAKFVRMFNRSVEASERKQVRESK